LTEIEKRGGMKALTNFINGKRTKNTSWCDWAIPLHWGGMSDPFQPIERKHKLSLQCLKIFAETKYPFIVSTKGKLLATEEYLSVLRECNAVVQISMLCSSYDKIELGCPSFEERLEMVRKIAPNCKRVIIRAQPYMLEVFDEFMSNIPRLKKAGAYGVTIEGMKFTSKRNGLVKVGADYCYPVNELKKHFELIKKECHKHGLKFYCAENRLREMGDNMTCCGIDGLEGFTPNTYNLCHIFNGERPTPTEKMKEVGTATAYSAINQTTVNHNKLKHQSFYGKTMELLKDKYELYKTIFNK
jgi:DNA repair photolyase